MQENINIVKLIDGEEIICEVMDIGNGLTLIGPMHVVPDDGEYGMRLRNTLLLSDVTQFTVDYNKIMFIYKPSGVMVEYYVKALEYAKKHASPIINQQIVESTAGIDKLTRIADNNGDSIVTNSSIAAASNNMIN